jgi:fluoride exporter
MVLNIALVAIGGVFWCNFPFWNVGIIIGSDLSNDWRLLIGTGFMGAFTTFSTFKLENIQLHMGRKWNMLILYLSVSYTFGILLAFAGMKVGASFYY